MLAQILELLNLIFPVATNLVLLIKNESGSTTAIIASAQTANAADIAQIQAWLTAHGGGSVATATAASVTVPAATPAPGVSVPSAGAPASMPSA